MGPVGHSGAGGRRPWRHLSGQQFRAGGEGPWCAGGHGRHLLQEGCHPAGGGPGEIARIRPCDRQRLVGGPRGTDHPDRFRPGFDSWADREDAGWTADRPGGGRRWRRHSRYVQHSDRRRHVRRRTDAAGGQRRDLSPGRHRDRYSDVRGSLVPRRCAGFPRSADGGDGHQFGGGDRPRLRGNIGSPGRSGVRRLHPRPASGRGPLRPDQVALYPAQPSEC